VNTRVLEQDRRVENRCQNPATGRAETLMQRARRAAVPLASSLVGTLAGGALAVGLVGCSALSPATIATPYAAADGVNGSLTNAADGSTVELRNMLIVAGAAGSGLVVGTLANSGQSAVQVLIGLQQTGTGTGPAPTRIAVPAGGAVQLGVGGPAQVVLTGVPVAGRVAALTAQTTGGGTVDLTVPVMAPEGFYSTLTPPPVTPSQTP
jgi:hypothetical protein